MNLVSLKIFKVLFSSVIKIMTFLIPDAKDIDDDDLKEV